MYPENLKPKTPGPRKPRTLKNLDTEEPAPQKRGKQPDLEKRSEDHIV